jgi:predicted peptidase
VFQAMLSEKSHLNRALLALFASLLFVPYSALSDHVSPNVVTLTPTVQAKIKSLNPEYLLYYKKQKSEASLPLVIYLHGAGGVGADINKIEQKVSRLQQGIEKFGEAPSIVAAPQALKKTRDGGGWIPEELDIFLNHLKATLPVDEKRIYLTGNSMGGYGTWVWAGQKPLHFAAIAPVVGGLGPGGPKHVSPDFQKWAANLANTPVYAFAGAKDKVVPAKYSELMIGEIRAAGNKAAKLKIYPNEGHSAGNVVFSSAEFYEWMFSKRRN